MLSCQALNVCIHPKCVKYGFELNVAHQTPSFGGRNCHSHCRVPLELLDDTEVPQTQSSSPCPAVQMPILELLCDHYCRCISQFATGHVCGISVIDQHLLHSR